MCGLVGIAGDLAYKDEKTFKILLMQDYFRGPDSTGFARLKKTGEASVVKIASHPIDFFGYSKFKEMLTGYGSSVFLGHNRFATKGAVNGYNAHPYQFGHIIGAHNGTLEKSSWDALHDLTGERFDVDSMAIFAAIAKAGIDEVVPLLKGAWALVYIDLSDMSLNMIRNDQRPLWYSYTKDFKKLMWASEWPMMRAATDLQGDPKDYERFIDSEGYQFFALKTDWHYKWDLDSLIKGSDERPKPRVKELKGIAPTPVIHTHYTGGTYVNGKRVSDPFQRSATAIQAHTQGQTQAKPLTQPQASHGTTIPGKSGSTVPATPDKVIHLRGTKTDPTGGFYTEAEFDAIARYGCSWCQADIAYDDKGVVIYDDRQQILCPDCAGTDGGQTRIFCLPHRLAS